VRRKGKYVNDRFLRRKDAEDWALHRRYRRDAIAWINREKSITPDKPFFVYFAPGAAIRSAPPIYQRSHRITANIVVPEDKTEGVIVATGGAGDTLYVKGGKVVYEHNFVDRARYRVVSDIPLPTGDVEVILDHVQKPFKQFIESTRGPAMASRLAKARSPT